MSGRLASSLLAVLLVAACSSGTSDTTGSDGSPSTTAVGTTVSVAAVPDTADDVAADLTDYLDDDGVLMLDVAKQIFAATFTALPGVEALPRSVPDSETHVLSLLADSREQLTDEQWAIVDDVIGGPGIPLDQLDVPGAGSVRRPYGARAAEAAPIIRAAVEEWSRRLGRSLSGGPAMLTVVELPLINTDTGAYNFANLANAATAIRLLNGGVYDECLIRLNTDSPFNAATFDSQVSHEVFHCFQYDLVNTNPLPKWIVEGMAAYAGEVFAGGSAQSGSWWARWIEEPTRPLTARSYDAIGIYSLSAELGNDPFIFADALLREPTFATMEAVTGPIIRDLLGTHYANEPGWGGQFTVVGPGAPRTKARRSPLTWVGGSGSFSRALQPGAIGATAYTFSAPLDVLVVASNGYGGVHFSNGAAASFGGGYLAAFCLLPGGCVCPGEASARADLVAASPDGFVGIGPGENPEFTSQSLDEYCAGAVPTTTAPPDGPGGDGCVSGTWQVNNELMAAEFQRVVSTATPGAPATDFVSSEVTGTWTLALGADGSMTMTASNWALAGTVLAPPGLGSEEEVQIVITISFDGTVTGGYSAAGGSVSFRDVTGALSAKATATFAGQTTDVTTPQLASLPIASGAASTYRCDGASLNLTPTVPNAMTMHFVRV